MLPCRRVPSRFLAPHFFHGLGRLADDMKLVVNDRRVAKVFPDACELGRTHVDGDLGDCLGMSIMRNQLLCKAFPHSSILAFNGQ